MRKTATGTKTVRDPVCGMDVDPANAAATVQHAGTTYHFCSDNCARRFQASPSRFLGEGARPSVKAMADEGERSWKAYRPLIVVFAMLALAVLVLGLADPSAGRFAFREGVARFMAGFFLVFAGFKLMDLRGFADGYATYDLLAMKVPAYGFVYPFIELAFGLLMLAGRDDAWLLGTEIAVMGFSGVGVAIKIAKKEPFQCACLGTFLKVPLTKVTLVEDFGMVALAILLLVL